MTEDIKSEGPSALEKKIIRQIEFYFGDINLPKDRFLQEQVKLDDGWIELETMIKFNRLKQLTEDFDVIREALKKSKAGLIEIHEDGEKIRRDPEHQLPEFNQERREDMKTRTIYIKGFPRDLSLDDVIEFLGKHGDVEHVQMRRDEAKEFKGSVFALFKSQEDVEKIQKLENFKHKEEDESTLKVMLKADYFKMKNEDKKSKDKDEKSERKEETEEEKREKMMERITKGALLHLVGIAEGTNREQMKELFGAFSPVQWVDFNIGDKEAILRFSEENQASASWEKAKEKGEGKVMLNGAEIQGDVLEGEAEVDHWENIFQAQKDRRGAGRGRGRGRGRGGFRGRGRGGGWGGGRNNHQNKRHKESENGDSEPAAQKVKNEGDSEPAAKKVKTEGD